MHLSNDRQGQIKRELAVAGVHLGPRHRFESFGNTPELAAELGALVVSGAKSATSAYEAVYSHFGAEYPRVGDVEIICSFEGELLAVIAIVDLRVVPFEEVGEEHARLEGEGDRSLEHWRLVHRNYFRGNCDSMGVEFTERDAVLCQRFRLLYVPAAPCL
jgi:uncharacterized protein YhfF